MRATRELNAAYTGMWSLRGSQGGGGGQGEVRGGEWMQPPAQEAAALGPFFDVAAAVLHALQPQARGCTGKQHTVAPGWCARLAAGVVNERAWIVLVRRREQERRLPEMLEHIRSQRHLLQELEGV